MTAAEGVGTPQIRNMGTVGGNIMQRPRCWYFRNEEFNCLKKGGSRCFAVEGENQFHAIFGDGPCHIVHPSSLAVPVIAYGGRFRVVGPNGAREIDAGEFFQMPNANLYGETVLQPNEIITHVILPAPGQRSAAYEVRFKQSHDWPLAAASVNLVMSGIAVKSARIVMGAVAPVPWRVQAAERVLAGKTITEAVATEAANAARGRRAADDGQRLQDSDCEDSGEARHPGFARVQTGRSIHGHPKPASPLVNEHHCGNLRHKGMYVMTVPDPGRVQVLRSLRRHRITGARARSGRSGRTAVRPSRRRARTPAAVPAARL